MEYTHTLTLDIGIADSGERPYPKPHVWVKQLDSEARALAVSLTQDGSAYTVPSGAAAELRIQRPDGVLVTASAAVSGSTVTAHLTDTMLAIAGQAQGDIRLTQSGQVLSAVPFVLHIEHTAQGRAHSGYVSDTVNVEMVTQAQYSAMTSRSTNTLYICSDTGNAYIGDIPITGGGGDATPHVICTQSEYDAMASHDARTIYIIVG